MTVEITAERGPQGAVRLVPVGRLDASNCDQLRQAITTALAGGDADVVIDLAGVKFPRLVHDLRAHPGPQVG